MSLEKWICKIPHQRECKGNEIWAKYFESAYADFYVCFHAWNFLIRNKMCVLSLLKCLLSCESVFPKFILMDSFFFKLYFNVLELLKNK